MLKVTLWLFCLALMAYAAMCAYLYSRQRSMLFYPTPAVTLDEAQVLWFSNEGASLKVWHIPASSGQALIYFGGNAEDVSQNIPRFRRLFPHHNIYLHNYRGYGGSSGKATERALFSDAVALYEVVAKKHQNIEVMGRSLGTGVAIYLAARKKTARLVLVTPFDSMARLAASYYPFFPVSLLMKDRFDSKSLVEGIMAPTLVLIAEHDEVIPRKIADSLVAALNPHLTSTVVIDGASHNTIGSYPQYEEALVSFLTESLPE